MQILMIVGSEMGNAEMVGDLVKDELEGLGHEVRVISDGGLAEAELDAAETLLVVSSTTGLGDVPQNVEALYGELVEERPDLGHLRYGLVGMGDRNYKDTYCGGPKKWIAILDELGATRVGEPLMLDATDHPTPDLDALAWLPGWLDALES
ncbi:MAG: flavodoxin domain-containing protein [Sandaracinaceae bacterium]|nr:flavodoxin domain-containing protein [Sandaracinaceae bacterium]